MSKYTVMEAEELCQPVTKGYKFCCCDCGLVHKLDFRIKDGKIQMRGDRDERATGQVRRWMKLEDFLNFLPARLRDRIKCL